MSASANRATRRALGWGSSSSTTKPTRVLPREVLMATRLPEGESWALSTEGCWKKVAAGRGAAWLGGAFATPAASAGWAPAPPAPTMPPSSAAASSIPARTRPPACQPGLAFLFKAYSLAARSGPPSSISCGRHDRGSRPGPSLRTTRPDLCPGSAPAPGPGPRAGRGAAYGRLPPGAPSATAAPRPGGPRSPPAGSGCPTTGSYP